jgi:hypothetical protein
MNTETVEPTTDTATTIATNGAMVHLARCTECGICVHYKSLPSGTGFTLVDSDLALGIGDNGRPICPEGHGEMELADDRLPATEAINQVAEDIQRGVMTAREVRDRDDAEKQRLPFPIPAYNYQGVLASLVDKRHEVAKLEKKVDDRKELLKAAKDELDTANVQLGKMIDQFEQDEIDRRQAVARQEADSQREEAAPRLVRCSWEVAHPDEDCPMCADEKLRPLAPDSMLHVEQVDRYRYLQESDVIIELVRAAGIRLPQDVVNAWSVEDRAAVKAWAEIENGIADTPESHERPAILGTAHVAEGVTTSEAAPGDTYQSCRECGARLLTVKTGGDPEDAIDKFEPYPAGTLVGTDCPGAGPARYPKRGRKKASA